ncbi:hypothetical protein [Nocardia paucivorans]|uniref:hypothetical protein n=1 Tax=Nocardia paucivorans TaxID=114259 RepID=UPI0003043BEE|nr:hypothetical protein [Nocardia paucivorans]
MVSPDTALRRLLRETAKLLQRYGFHGTDPTWTRIVDGGVASVGRTRVLRTWTNGRQTRSFGLTLNATPTAWWEYCNWCNAQRGLPAIPLENATGPGVLDMHPHSAELTTPWILRVDPDQLEQHALQSDIDTIREQLPRRVHAYARRALQLLEPQRYLDELLAHPDQGFRTREAIVVLLADRGPGPQLDEAIHNLRRYRAEQETSDRVDEILDYVRYRADLPVDRVVEA